jgi:hypothetical protein
MNGSTSGPNDERHLVGYQAADEVHVTVQTVELRHDHRHGLAELVGRLDGDGELRPAVERVGALAVSISLTASAMR